MSLHRYGIHALAGDYMRAGAGLAIAGAPLLMLDVAGVVAVTLGGLAVLFAVFGARTAWRHRTVLEITGDGIILREPARRQVRWSELTGCRLDYFAPRREDGEGWMQLTVKGAGQTIRVESTIAGFDRIAAAVAGAATACEIELTDITAANFNALGITFPAHPFERDAA